MCKELNVTKERNLLFVCRNAYKNSWPVILLPKPLLMGLKVTTKVTEIISSEESHIHDLE